jgi:hypothetical protein
MIDIRKALKLLDVVYVNQNESVKSSLDKVTMLAQLDMPSYAMPGPFEQFYVDYESMKWHVSRLESRLQTLEGYIQYPYSNHNLNVHMVNYVTASPQFVSAANRITDVETNLQVTKTLLSNLLTPKQEEDESELNSNAE